MSENYINHIAIVLDASGSMDHLVDDVIKVTDNQVAYLAKRSKELDQETRVTIYSFEGKRVTCLVYDKDVLRLPSIEDLYKIGGMTNLIDATLKSIEDLEKTPELYGEHAFLIYVMTDGGENSSRHSQRDLSMKLAALKDHWTLAAFVPNANGVHEAKKFGFPKDNIQVWDTSAKGINEMGEIIRRTSESFMTGRSKGIRGYRNLFSLDVEGLSVKSVRGLSQLKPGQFRLYDVPYDIAIADFVEQKTGRRYQLGEAYYQIAKPVVIQPQKQIAIYDKNKHAVYTGDGARKLLGLPTSHDVRVAPVDHPDYIIFPQSTSMNRKLFAGTKLLIL